MSRKGNLSQTCFSPQTRTIRTPGLAGLVPSDLSDPGPFRPPRDIINSRCPSFSSIIVDKCHLSGAKQMRLV